MERSESLDVLSLFQNTLVLCQVSAHLDVRSLLSLGGTSKTLQRIVYETPQVFQRLDLSEVAGPLRHTQSLENFQSLGDPSTDEYFAQPLRRAFGSLQRRNVLSNVRTMILDGLSVPLPIASGVLCDSQFSIRLLSLRGVKDLGHEKLMRILRYVIRPGRPEGTPRLKGLYYFTPLHITADYSRVNLQQRHPQLGGVTNSVGAQLGAGTSSSGDIHRHLVQSTWHQSDPWYSHAGDVLDSGSVGRPERMDSTIEEHWAQLMQAFQGLVAFDAVLCPHTSSEMHERFAADDPNCTWRSMPRMATISLGGCQKCGSCPEQPAYPGKSPQYRLPLLAPPPLHSSSVKIAQRLHTNGLPHPPFIARCRTCLKDRWCERCNAWWCESCYSPPTRRIISKIDDSSQPSENAGQSIKVQNNLCVEKCLMDELLNGVGEGGMWG